MLNKYNAELFKYKEGFSSQLDQISDGMDKSKAYYKQKLANAYGNEALWNSVEAEIDDNVKKWDSILSETTAYWKAKKAEIDRLPLCPN